MPLSNQRLWDRITDYDFDQPATVARFSERIASENGWTLDFAEKVIFEYRKFVYLACVADGAVTPSDQVDQAWHLHLTHTHEYWQNFCRNILERDLHHVPTQGGVDEDTKYVDWYGRTMKLYREEFDVEPPADVWPASEERFLEPRFMQRIDTRAHWVVRRSLLPRLLLACLAILLIVSGCFVGAHLVLSATSDQIAFLIIAAIFGLFVIDLFAADRKRPKNWKDGDSSGCGSSGCGGD